MTTMGPILSFTTGITPPALSLYFQLMFNTCGKRLSSAPSPWFGCAGVGRGRNDAIEPNLTELEGIATLSRRSTAFGTGGKKFEVFTHNALNIGLVCRVGGWWVD